MKSGYVIPIKPPVDSFDFDITAFEVASVNHNLIEKKPAPEPAPLKKTGHPFRQWLFGFMSGATVTVFIILVIQQHWFTGVTVGSQSPPVMKHFDQNGDGHLSALERSLMSTNERLLVIEEGFKNTYKNRDRNKTP